MCPHLVYEFFCLNLSVAPVITFLRVLPPLGIFVIFVRMQKTLIKVSRGTESETIPYILHDDNTKPTKIELH